MSEDSNSVQESNYPLSFRDLPDAEIPSEQAAQMLGIGRSSMMAFRKAMGIRRKRVNPRDVFRFRQKHPEFVPSRVEEWLEERGEMQAA